MDSKVELLKLVNGEFLIGEVERDDENVIVTKVLQVATVPSEEGGTQLVFVDFNGRLSNSESLNIKNDKVVYTLSPTNEVEESYQNSFKSQSEIITPQLDLGSLTE